MRNSIANTSPIRKKVILKIYRERSNVSEAYLKNLMPAGSSKGGSK